MKLLRSLGICGIGLFVLLGTVSPKEGGTDQGVERLVAGNARFVSQKVNHPNQTSEHRDVVAKGQHPFAIILSCSDSRVPPEVVFDQGLGDLFVVRVAGNIVDDAGLGSIEYAAEHLHVPLVLVLGHSKCGAVTAALQGGEAAGHISKLVTAIKPAVEKVKDQEGDKLDNAVRANVRLVVEQLKTSKPLLAHLVEEKHLTVVGGRYDLDTGKVEILK